MLYVCVVLVHKIRKKKTTIHSQLHGKTTMLFISFKDNSFLLVFLCFHYFLVDIATATVRKKINLEKKCCFWPKNIFIILKKF